MALLLLKNVFDPGFLEKLPGILSLLRELLVEKETGMQYLETVIRYVFNAADGITVEGLGKMVSTSLTKDKEEVVMTLAEDL